MKEMLSSFIFFSMVVGESQKGNYIRFKTYKKQSIMDIVWLSINQVAQNLISFDRLGRLLQQVALAQSNSGNDVVAPMVCNAFRKLQHQKDIMDNIELKNQYHYSTQN